MSIRPDVTMLAGKYQWSHAWVMELLHQGLINEEGIDLYRQPWSWDPKAVLEGAGQISTNTRLIDFPRGGRIVLLGWPQLLIGHQLRLLGFPALTSFNLAFLGVLSTAPFFGYLFARLNALRPLASAFAALIFSSSPYMLCILYNGQVAKTSHGFIAGLACAAVALGRGQWGWGFVLGPLLPICFGASPYYFIFSIPLCFMLFLYSFAESDLVQRVKGTIASVLSIAIGLYGCFPLLFHFKGRIKSLLAPATGGQNADFFGITATPLSLVWPVELRMGGGNTIPGEHHITYLGIGVIALCLMAIITSRNRKVILWAGIALFFILFSFGSAEQAGSPVPLPTDILLNLMPEEGAFIMRYRAIVVATLMMGVLAGTGLQHFINRYSIKWSWGIGVLTLADIWLLPAPPFPIQTETVHLPRVYAEHAQVDELYGLVEFPCDILGPNSISPDYFARLNILNQKQLFYQIYHRKGLGMVDKANMSRETYQLPLMRGLQEKAFDQSGPPMGSANQDSILWLKSNGFRYLILHESYIPPENRQKVLNFLSEELGEGQYFKQDAIWQFPLTKP